MEETGPDGRRGDAARPGPYPVHRARSRDAREGGTRRRSALSQHLAVLRRAGLVSARRRGRRRLYALRPEGLRRVADWVAWFERFWDRKLEGLGAHLEAETEGGA